MEPVGESGLPVGDHDIFCARYLDGDPALGQHHLRYRVRYMERVLVVGGIDGMLSLDSGV